MTKSCSKCGATLTADLTFCRVCGAAVGQSPTAAPAAPARAAVPRTTARPYVLGTAAAIVVVAIAATAFTWWRAARGQPAQNIAPTAAPATTEPAPSTDSLMALADEAEAMSRRQAELTRQMQDTIARYQARSGGKLPAGLGAELTPDQRALLTERLKTERMGTASLLQDLLSRDRELQDLRQRIADLNTRLPDNVIAQDGDRHERIAMTYLERHGLDTAAAYRLVSRASLTEPLIKGFRVFLVYQNGQLGTWVTQGDASASPQALRDQVTKMATQERDAALQALDATKSDRDDLRNLANAADRSRQDTQSDLAAMTAAAEREQAANRTLRYVIGSKSELVKNKVIDGSYRLLPAKSPGTALVASAATTLPPIDPGAYGLRKIGRVMVVPGLVAEGEDYRISTIDGFFSLSILRPERFAQYAKFFVVVLE